MSCHTDRSCFVIRTGLALSYWQVLFSHANMSYPVIQICLVLSYWQIWCCHTEMGNTSVSIFCHIKSKLSLLLNHNMCSTFKVRLLKTEFFKNQKPIYKNKILTRKNNVLAINATVLLHLLQLHYCIAHARWMPWKHLPSWTTLMKRWTSFIEVLACDGSIKIQ